MAWVDDLARRYTGHRLPPHSAEVERGRLRFFAKTIGETDPVYLDDEAARDAGHRSLPVPPTFLFCLDMDMPEPYAYLDEMGIELGRVLHGEQSFRYHRMAYADDRLSFQSRISDIYTKKEGALLFMLRDTAVHNQGGELVAELQSLVVIRNDVPGGAA